MNIDRDEVLRYLGYKGQKIDDSLNQLIDSCIDEIKAISKPLYTYGIFDVEVMENEVLVKGTNLILRGNDITNHLKNSKKCVIVAATLGFEVDKRIMFLGKSDITRGVVLDSCGTEAVESLCNMVEYEVEQRVKNEGFNLNFRFSPGYGDFPIDVQSDILNVLNTQNKIGLTCTESNILLPRKSITAVMGFICGNNEKIKRGCNICLNNKNCLYRREGVTCGK